jgi:hypothetical protein
MIKRYCPYRDEQPDPCPLCGATASGNDLRRGVCAYPDSPPTDYGIRIILVDRRTGKPI